MDNKFAFWDYEYNSTAEKELNLVSCSISFNDTQETYWLQDHQQREELKQTVQSLKDEGYTFVSYAATAESRATKSLGIDPIGLKQICLFIEYRCLTNHNHNWMYGKQLIGGKVVTTSPIINDRNNNSKPEHNLASACFKVLGEKIDTKEKDEVRDIIINGTPEEVEANKERILRYNESDIQYLPRLFKGVISEYKRLLPEKEIKTLKEEMLLRGNYAARTAVMESLGYPIDYNATRAFADSVPSIIWETQAEINGLFPRISPFRKGNDRSFSWRQKQTREWIEEQGFSNWVKTDTGQPSLSLEAWKKYFPYSHNYPKDNFGAQMVRYLTLRQQLNGFLQSKTAKRKNNFWDYVGSDKRVRPYFGIYGSQSARSQPKATGFLFLKSAWMRSLCVPPSGRAICGIDYKSQEFLLAALLSGDEVMLKAYQSGDPYLYLAKVAGAVPWDGTKKEYARERDIFKTVTLALQYGMGQKALAEALTEKLGEKFSEVKAKSLIRKFNGAYKIHYKWKKTVLKKYHKQGYWKLPCGWYLFGDNQNDRSVGNCPIQGFGSSIMRKAVSFAQEKGLSVILTLHDAIYIEFDSDDLNAPAILAESMDKAFRYYFSSDVKPLADVGLDGALWSNDYPEVESEITVGKAVLKKQKIYVDERGANEYEHFKKYFEPEEFNL